EIIAGDQDLGLAVSRLVEHEIRILAAVVAIALLGEQTLAEPGALGRLQVLFGDDHVGIDIDHLQRRGDAFEHGELFHSRSCGLDRAAKLMKPWPAEVKSAPSLAPAASISIRDPACKPECDSRCNISPAPVAAPRDVRDWSARRAVLLHGRIRRWRPA